MNIIASFVNWIYQIFWGTLISIPIGSSSLDLSLMVIMLVFMGIFFSFKTKFLFFRYFKDMVSLVLEKKTNKDGNSVSGLQTLIISTATRVGMGNLVGVVAAIGAGGAGAIFWMWVMAILNTATAYIESTLAYIYREKDELYGGHKGGPAYYIHAFFRKKDKSKLCIVSILFVFSAIICWGGVTQVIGNSVAQGLYSAYSIPPLYTTIVFVFLSAIIVFRKNATVKVLDVVVPVMALFYIAMTIFVMILNINVLPDVITDIISQAFGIKQVVAGGIGAVIMNGIKRGLFSNEAGSGSAPCAAACADVSHPAKTGLLQAFGVFIDTVIICTCTAMILLLVPEPLRQGLDGMPLLFQAMDYHFGAIGVFFMCFILFLFSFSTFLGILFYGRGNVSYIWPKSMKAQSVYKLFSLAMLFAGGLSSYSFVWDLGDVGIAWMTLLNFIVLLPMSKEAIKVLKEYKKSK